MAAAVSKLALDIGPTSKASYTLSVILPAGHRSHAGNIHILQGHNLQNLTSNVYNLQKKTRIQGAFMTSEIKTSEVDNIQNS